MAGTVLPTRRVSYTTKGDNIKMASSVVTVTVDTEEDGWSAHGERDPDTYNITRLPALQALLDGYGARPTYFVNRPPLLNRRAVEILGTLAARQDVELAGHCHPWNTPPFVAEFDSVSMMNRLPLEVNQQKIREVTSKIVAELGVRPRSFRCGRWALGANVALALYAEGYRTDCSVTPLIDWSKYGGPDFETAPLLPYRFVPEQPLQPEPSGPMVELPATAGFLRGDHRRMAVTRRWIRDKLPVGYRIAGALDRLRILQLRRLSPETSSAADMARLIDTHIAAGNPVINITFHSCSLLAGATPYARTEDECSALLARLSAALQHCIDRGLRFSTVAEASQLVT
jgi:hypothetical protein